MSTPLAGWSALVTSEHGGNEIPHEHRTLFRGRDDLVASHRGWDPGTRALAESLAAGLGAPAIFSGVTRLLVDLNRSAHNPRVFSEITRPLPRKDRIALLERFHRPHWDRVLRAVERGVAGGGRVLHLGIHSFTPVLEEGARRPDLAVLYDPARPAERALSVAWARALGDALPGRVVRRNNPYRGSADGITTALRRTLAGTHYLGLEIEVNQRHVGRDGRFPNWVADTLMVTLRDVLPSTLT